MIGILPQLGLLLAEAADATNKVGGAAAGAKGGVFDSMLPGLLVVMALFYFFMIRPQKNRENELRKSLESLKETDRVVTIGGIHGIVTNVQRDAGIVTVRVDESTGAKIRVGASAIARIITDDEKAE